MKKIRETSQIAKTGEGRTGRNKSGASEAVGGASKSLELRDGGGDARFAGV